MLNFAAGRVWWEDGWGPGGCDGVLCAGAGVLDGDKSCDLAGGRRSGKEKCQRLYSKSMQLASWLGGHSH